jgi:hypothetical protein
LLDVDILVQSLDAHYTKQRIADSADVSRMTVYRYLNDTELVGLLPRHLTDAEMADYIEFIKSEQPELGCTFVQGALKRDHFVGSRARIHGALLLVDPLGTRARHRRLIPRRVYSVPGPNYLWHGDSHLKLGRWGFVTFGVVDGHTRTVVGCRCARDNTSRSAMRVFLDGIAEYGIPLRYRCDHGLENYWICVWMIEHLGRDRNACLLGPSTHNVRIERFWGDIMRACLCTFYSLFYEMEDAHILDAADPLDRFVLGYVYLPRINRKIELFRQTYNNHTLATMRASPRELFARARLEGKVFTGPGAAVPADDIDPATYGIEDSDDVMIRAAERREREEEERGIRSIHDDRSPLNTWQLTLLHTLVNPLAASDSNGVELYLRARVLAHSLLTLHVA